VSRAKGTLVSRVKVWVDMQTGGRVRMRNACRNEG